MHTHDIEIRYLVEIECFNSETRWDKVPKKD
jgi:hypothetical protein